jgi:hypothetical protein
MTTRTRLLLFVVLTAALAWLGIKLARVQQERREESEKADAYLRRASEKAARGNHAPQPPPQPRGSILALDCPALAILQQLPGRPAVDVAVRADRPAHRIIHLADWHLVPEDLFARDLRGRLGRPPSREELAKHFREHLLQVEGVQQEQMAILRHLIRHHGLTTVLQEGVTAEDYEDYQLRLDLLAGEEEDKDFDLTDDRHAVLLQVGAAGRLLIRHELQSVLPLESKPGRFFPSSGRASTRKRSERGSWPS